MLIALLYWWKFRLINIKLLSAFNFGAKLLIWYNTSVRVHYIKDKAFLKSILLFLSCKFCFTIKVCFIPLTWHFTLPSPLYIDYTYLEVSPNKLVQIGTFGWFCPFLSNCSLSFLVVQYSELSAVIQPHFYGYCICSNGDSHITA